MNLIILIGILRWRLGLKRHEICGYLETKGIDNIVINADLIQSEAEEHVDPVLLDFKNSYGSPLIVIRDMAKGIKLSVEKNFPNASQQICQIHFLSNLEKDLITEHHKKLKNSIVKQNLTSQLKSLRYENNDSGDTMIKRKPVLDAQQSYLLYS